jgi:hypothetical protein
MTSVFNKLIKVIRNPLIISDATQTRHIIILTVKNSQEGKPKNRLRQIKHKCKLSKKKNRDVQNQ